MLDYELLFLAKFLRYYSTYTPLKLSFVDASIAMNYLIYYNLSLFRSYSYDWLYATFKELRGLEDDKPFLEFFVYYDFRTLYESFV